MRSNLEIYEDSNFDGLVRTRLEIDPKAQKACHIVKHDVAVICTENEWEKINGPNGFTKSRNQRHVGEIPIVEFFELQRQAEEAGTELTGDDLKKHLRKNPEYLTVNAIDTGRDPRIIIK